MRDSDFEELSTVDVVLIYILVLTGLVTLASAFLTLIWAAAFTHSLWFSNNLAFLLSLPLFVYTAMAWFAAYKIREPSGLALTLFCSLPCLGLGYALWWPLNLLGTAMVVLCGIRVWRKTRKRLERNSNNV